ncbi:hypothetical protein SLE2022_346950 [Rubroshorea leprosula]
MDIDLRLPSGEQCKEDEIHNGIDDSMLDGDEKLQLHNGDVGNMMGVGEVVRADDGEDLNSSAVDMGLFKEDTNLEPLSGMEFESHGEAYSFYQEYARSIGFNTAIQNSRRSKTSREFIDAKFACSSTSNKSLVEAVTSPTHGLICIEEDNQSRSTSKTNKKKNPAKKKKVNSEQEIMNFGAQDSLQQVDKLSPRPVSLDGYFGTQQSVQGMVQLNLMAPRDNYYGNQQGIQGVGQLNTMPTNPDGYYGTQQTMPAMGQMDFFRTHGFYIRDDPSVRAAQLHDDASRHG